MNAVRYAKKLIITLFTVAVIPALLSGCFGFTDMDGAQEVGPNFGSSGGGGGGNLDALLAFEQTVHPVIMNDCNSCHGNAQVPLFAVADTADSYDNSLPLMNMNNLSSSRFAVKANDGHCGSAVCSDNTVMMAALTDLKESTNINNEPVDDTKGFEGRFVTANITVPGGLPEFSDVGNDIDNLQDVTFPIDGNTSLIVKMGHLGPESLIIGEPRLQVTSGDYRNLSNLMIHANNEFGLSVLGAINNTYGDNDVLTNATTILPAMVGNQIKLSFFRYQVTQGVKNLALFVSTVRPILNSCGSCHNGRPFNTAQPTDATLALEALQYSNLVAPTQSGLYKARSGNHGGGVQLSQGEWDTIEAWLNSER